VKKSEKIETAADVGPWIGGKRESFVVLAIQTMIYIRAYE
jgi:hypothetical protein